MKISSPSHLKKLTKRQLHLVAKQNKVDVASLDGSKEKLLAILVDILFPSFHNQSSSKRIRKSNKSNKNGFGEDIFYNTTYWTLISLF